MSAFKTIGISFVITLCTCMVLFNDLFWFHNQSLMWHHDAEIPYEDTFFLISNLFQGGLQIFDRYDGTTFAFNHLGHGLYTLSNIATSLIAFFLLTFQNFPGEAYHHIFSLVHPSLNILLRLIGGYVLLRKFKLSNGAIIITLVVLNTFLSTTMYFGFVANNLYSYFPFLAYFIINYIEKFRCQDFIAFVLLFLVAISGNPLLGLGYFYQNVHFLLITALIYGLMFHRKNISLSNMVKPNTLKLLGWAVIIGACIIIPSAIFFHLLGKDFFVEGSGLSGTHGRFNSMFNVTKYFSPKGESILSLAEFPFKLIDYANTTWEKSWIFWGASVVLLLMMGMVCSKIRMKYIFMVASILVVITNVPLATTGPLSIAHWINALTNPFSFLLRSYHMPILLLPYLIFPLVGFGLQAGWDMIEGRVSQKRLQILLGLYVLLLFVSAWFLAFEFKIYFIAMLGLAILFVYVCKNRCLNFGRLNTKHATIIIFCVFMAVDTYALKQYYDSNQYKGTTEDRGGYLSIKDGRHIKPTVYDAFEDKRPLIVEYQNPRILPYREYFRIMPSDTEPAMRTTQGHFGYFFHYMPLERYYTKASIYVPRPKIYEDWENNIGLYRALAQDQRFLVLAFGSPEGPRQKLQPRVTTYRLFLNQAKMNKKGKVLLYSIKLPKEFPAYEATAIFTEDRNRIILEGLKANFSPAQGAIVEPFTFDVNNVKDGYLVLGVPKDDTIKVAELTLKLIQSGDILNVWRNKSDEQGITFLASQDGWLITHYPYDEKWQVWIDGQRVVTSKVNGYFLGVPIGTGEHKVLFKYWPQSPLRFFIPLSIFCCLGVLFWVIKKALRSLKEC